MEDHHRHHHQYGITDLRQLVNGPRPTHFPTMPPPPKAELFPGDSNLQAATQQHYEMMMFGRQVADIIPRCLHDFAPTDSATNIAVATPTTTTSASTPPLSCLEAETAGCIGGDASTGRWPRQETLTLLEIRSRLDSKFKEANQKGPLWVEVSRYHFKHYSLLFSTLTSENYNYLFVCFFAWDWRSKTIQCLCSYLLDGFLLW